MVINIDSIIECVDENLKPLYAGQIQHLYNVEWASRPVVSMLNFLKTQNVKKIADIGANLGVSLIKFYEYFYPFDKYIGFEPDELNYKVLSNVAKKISNTKCINTGIFYGKKQAKVKGVGADKPNPSPGGYFIEEIENDIGTNLGPTTYFSDKIFNLNELELYIDEPFDLIKVDVEGSEYNIIRNSTVLKQSKFLLIEFHNNTQNMIFSFIEKHLSNFELQQSYKETFLLKS